MLELARCQGLLYSHQVPPSVNGQKIKADANHHSHERIMTDWLAGKGTNPARSSAPCPAILDQDLDLAQREAVARALATPDICLIQGLPGAGKSRVAAEILRQAVRQGFRVLLAARQPVALDVILRRLANDPLVFALRSLDIKETVEKLPADIRPFTLGNRRDALKQELRERAQGNRQAAEGVCRRRSQEESLWPQLREATLLLLDVRARLAAVVQQHDSLLQLLQRISTGEELGELPSNCTNLIQGLAKLKDEDNSSQARWAEARQVLAEKLAACEQNLHSLNEQRRSKSPLAEARAAGKWWTWRWWQAMFRGDVRAQLEQIDHQLTQANEASLELEKQLEQLDSDERDERHARRRRLVEDEKSRCHQASQECTEALAPEQDRLTAAWQGLVDQLDSADRPSEASLMVLDAVEAKWRQRQGNDEAACRWAQEWQKYLESHCEALSQQLLSQANVRAVPWSAIPQEARAVNEAGDQSLFDLLVLDEAERFTDSEIVSLTRLARRWVMISDQAEPGFRATCSEAHRSQSLTRLNSFEKLWDALHGPDLALPYRWSKESERWCCNLRPLAGEDMRHIETERLADAPDIELRILFVPKTTPALAQVVFPMGMGLVQAKSYIGRELQEFPIQPAARYGWWREDGNRRLFQLCAHETRQVEAVELEPGLTEWVTPAGATWALEFDEARGWSGEQAEAWVQKHLHVRDNGRTISLHTPYRLQGGLARTLGEVLLLELPADQIDHAPVGSGLEWVSVPPPRKSENGKKAASGMAWPKEGAGLEQDLTAPRLADRLPADLRAELPRQGLVNYFEAQAVVKCLETLAPVPPSSVLVLALHDAQAELIRRLAARSVALQSRPSFFAVGVPADFSHCEASVVLLSCTRSHVHRAVPFGQNPRDLIQALTRARDRLLVFADPGTVIKRSQWQGPLEQHDAAAANGEARILARLLRFFAHSTSAVR